MYPIPANATRIRYLESTGTQYVDTGVVPTTSSVIAVNGAWTYRSTQTVDAMQMGVVEYNSPSNKSLLFCNQQGGITYYAWGASDYFSNNPLPSSVNYHLDAPRGTIQINNSTYSFAPSYSFIGSFYLFKRNLVGFSSLPAEHWCKYRLTSASFTDGSNLVRSFVPVRVGQVGYLFDRVSGQLFGNAGTGDFVCGPDTFAQGVVPTRMCVMGVRKRPYDAEVEWLENAPGGGQFINTGVNLTSDTTMEVVYQPLEFPTDKNGAYVICGSRSDVSNVLRIIVIHGANDNLDYTCIQKGSFATDWKTRYSAGFVTAKAGPTSGSINSDTFTLPSVQSANTPIYLFGQYASGLDPDLLPASYRMRVASFRIWQGQNLVRDYIPVRKGEIGYLFDRVSGQLFGNAGTGSFTIGPDK